MKTMGIRDGIVRSLGIAALVLSLVLGFGQHASANQSGSGVNDRTTTMQRMCEMGGGSHNTIVTRTIDGLQAATVWCIGGGFDGWTCSFFKTESICTIPGEGASHATSSHDLNGNDQVIVADPEPAIPAAVPATDIDETTASVEVDVDDDPLPTETATPVVDVTAVVDVDVDEIPVGDITAEPTATPLVEPPIYQPDLTEIQDAAPIVEVTFEAAP